MSIANYAEYLVRANNLNYQTWLSKSSITTVAGRLHSLWTATPLSGATPSVPVVLSNVTAGALPFINSLDAQRIAQVEVSSSSRNMVIICDRLSHQGGLSGTVIGEQFTNLPTHPLTRYTDGIGVMAALEIFTAIGTTSTTISLNYTNHLGVSGRVTSLIVIGGVGFNEATRFIMSSLAGDDRGIRSVENVALTASTGTVGNFGVTLFKPLFAFPVLVLNSQMLFDSILGVCGNMPQVLNNACLFALVVSTTTVSGDITAAINIVGE